MIWLKGCWVGQEITDWESNGKKGNKTEGGFTKEDRPRQCHPLGHGVMKGNYMQQLAKAFKGQVIYTKGSFQIDDGMEH